MLFKRFVCPNCGATGPLPARTPFLHCEACRTTCDFDWAVAHVHPEWGRHEALSQLLCEQRKSVMTAAVKAHDTMAWLRAYRDVLERLFAEFPTVYPVRITEPAYRAHLLEFLAGHQARLATRKKLVATQERITKGSMAVEWKRKNRANVETLWPVIDIALAHFDVQDRIARDEPPGLPPDFAASYMRQVGISMTVQEWLRFLDPEDQRALVERLGVAHQYLERAEGTIVCMTCGGDVEVHGNTHIPCPYCTASIRHQRAGILEHNEMMGNYAFITSELQLALDEEKSPLEAIEILDGKTRVDGKDFRIVTLRAGFARKIDAIFQATDRDDDGPNAKLAFAWAEVHAAERKLALRRLPYREHPRCASLPDGDELLRRHAEVGGELVATGYGKGFSYEALVDGAVVRLACDETGERTGQLRRLVTAARPPAGTRTDS